LTFFRPIFSAIESIVALFEFGLNLIKTVLGSYSVSAVLHENKEIKKMNKKKGTQNNFKNVSIFLPVFFECNMFAIYNYVRRERELKYASPLGGGPKNLDNMLSSKSA